MESFNQFVFSLSVYSEQTVSITQVYNLLVPALICQCGVLMASRRLCNDVPPQKYEAELQKL